MTTRTILASDLKAGDVLVEGHQRWRVDVTTINPRRKYNNVEGDMLVDVDATGLDFKVPCTRFSSYTPATALTIEAP